jgi:hypothetical protein
LNNFRIEREKILPFEATSRSYRVKTAGAKIKEPKVFLFKKRQEKFSGYYKMNCYLRVCNDVNGLTEEAGFPYNVNKWKLYKNAYEHE